MLHFGLFSTHLPYIITIAAYLLSYGFYTLSKPKECASESDVAVAPSSSTARFDNAVKQGSYNASRHFQVQQAALPEQKESPSFTNEAQTRISTPATLLVTQFYKVYELFSRPPTRG